MPKWITRTYTYAEPVGDPNTEPESGGIDGPDTYADAISAIRGAGSRADFDAGYESGYRAGWVAGYSVARHSDAEVERGEP